VAAVLVAAAVTIRIVYAIQLSDSPIARMQQWRQTDMHYFSRWAGLIAAGDWRSEALPLPMHSWHHDVAALARTDPVRPVRLGAGELDSDEALWRRWMHVPQFYQDPLYPYLLALVTRLTRHPTAVMLSLQLCIGAGSVLLIWLLTRRVFDDVVATIAGAAAVLSAPLLFYEGLLLRDSLVTVAGLGIAWLLMRAWQGGLGRWMLLGAAIGAACTLKSTFWLFGVAALIAVLFGMGGDARRALASAAAIAGGIGLGVAALAARNVSVGVPALALASSGPVTFVSANSATSIPDVGFGIDASVLAAFLGSTDGTWRAAVRSAARGQSLGQYLALEWRKFDRTWHWYEIPNNENFYYAREQIPILRILPITFWTVAPFAAWDS
jgi:hypothetical protein